jgi:hypothetical protein
MECFMAAADEFLFVRERAGDLMECFGAGKRPAPRIINTHA